MVLLSVRDLHKRYGPDPVLDGVTFDVRPGERIALVGPNGSGKTTMLKAVAGRRNRTRARSNWPGRRGRVPRAAAPISGGAHGLGRGARRASRFGFLGPRCGTAGGRAGRSRGRRRAAAVGRALRPSAARTAASRRLQPGPQDRTRAGRAGVHAARHSARTWNSSAAASRTGCCWPSCCWPSPI